MNDLPPIEHAADGIEQGKRLIRQGGDGGLSLSERIADRLQRLAWRTPLHAMRLRGRYPLKLLTVADDPFFGDVDRGEALLAGMMRFRGETRNLHELALEKPTFSDAFGEHLHSFEWLRDLSSVTTRVRAAPVAEELMRQWIAAHGTKVSDPAWRGDLWGRRILFWVAHAPLILSSTDLVYRSGVLHTLARGARHLERTADRTPPGAPRIAAWCGVVAAGLVIPMGDARRIFGEAGLARALAQAVSADGGIAGRSPDALVDAIRQLTMLKATYAARRLEPTEPVRDALQRMVAAMLGLTHGDRGLSSWQGTVPLHPDRVAELVQATGVRTRPLRQSREWGYQRLAMGGTVVILDAAPPPTGRAVQAGCASTLAFEFSDGPARIVVNCGGAGGAAQGVPDALRQALRTTAAHSTLILRDSNSSALLPEGTLGKGVGEVELSRQEQDATSRIEASHDGYARRYGFLHRRQLVLAGEGRDLRGEDVLLPAGRRKPRDAAGFAIRFHLGPTVEAAATADGQAAILRLAGGAMWQFRARGAALAIEPSLWIDAEGHMIRTEQIVLTGEAAPGGATVSWLFHRSR